MHRLDFDYLPEISGTFERFLINPRGDADGMLLTNGAEVHFPPHMSAELCAAIHAGAIVKVRGVQPRGDMIAAVAFETGDGTRIVDNGPPNGHGGEGRAATPEHRPMD